MLAIIAFICVVISHTIANPADNTQQPFRTNFDSRFRSIDGDLSNLADRLNQGSDGGQNGAQGYPNNANVQGSDGNYGRQNGAIDRSNKVNANAHNSDRNYGRQNDALDRSNNANANVRRSDGKHGYNGAQNQSPARPYNVNYNVPDSETSTFRADANPNPNNCNVQAWNEQFERVEANSGFSNPVSHPNPVVRCQQETVVRGKDIGNVATFQTTSTSAIGSYRSNVHFGTGDARTEYLAKQFGAY